MKDKTFNPILYFALVLVAGLTIVLIGLGGTNDLRYEVEQYEQELRNNL